MDTDRVSRKITQHRHEHQRKCVVNKRDDDIQNLNVPEYTEE